MVFNLTIRNVKVVAFLAFKFAAHTDFVLNSKVEELIFTVI